MISKSSIIFIFLFTICKSSFSQQDPQYTQYMYNTMSVNPAYAGSNGHTIITLLGRTQWVGLAGAPDTQTLSYDTSLGYSSIGLGMNLTNDRIGPASEIYLDANISYTVRMGKEGNLAFGLKLGGRYFNVDWNKGTVQNRNSKFLKNGNINEFLPTIGAGIYYHSPKWYLGLAIPNIIDTDHYDDAENGGDVSHERLHFFGIAGYVFDISETLKFKPAILTKIVSGAPISIDVSGNFLFSEKITSGLAWRWGDSLSALLGFQATENLNVGFAYDLTTSNYSNYNSGTYEIMIRWNIFKEQVMKSARFY